MAIAKAHAFADANKRTAYETARFFLLQYGIDIEADRHDAADMVENAVLEVFDEDYVALWFERRSVEAPNLED